MVEQHQYTIQSIGLVISTTIASWFHYLGLDAEVFAIYGVLLIADFITGLGRAYSLSIPITSKDMRVGMISKMSLLIVPIALGLGFKIAGAEGIKALEVGMIILALSEVYSVISNIHAINTGKDLPEFDALASLAGWLKSIILKYEDGTK